MKLKGIIEYILRVIIFLILTAFLHDKISEKLIEILEHIATILYEKVPFFNGNDNMEILLSFIIGFASLFIVCIGVTYYFAKITGIFKKLDSIKKWQSFLMFVFMCTIFIVFSNVANKYKIISFDFYSNIGFCGIFLIPSYLCYLYFKHLTKKHPVPFEKIGYYFSIEFYKNIFDKFIPKNELDKIFSKGNKE